MRYDMVAGDLEPPIGATLTDPNNVGSIAGCTVYLIMSQADGTKRVKGIATILDPVNRVVSYQWQAGDTDTAGVYRAQWQVVYTGGAPESFPSDEPIYIVIAPAL